MALLAACPARDPAPAAPPTYRAPRVQPGAIAVDGRLDEAAWASAPVVTLVQTMTGAQPRQATRARVLWAPDHLYVAFECEDDWVWARPGRRHDDPIYEDEVVEVFVDRDGDGRDYDEVQVSPANIQFDAQFVGHRSDLAAAKRWSAGMRSAVAVEGTLDESPGDRGWRAELAIPAAGLSGLRGPLSPGERLRFNLYRLDMRNRAGLWEGAGLSPPLRPDFHALDRFAGLELAP